MTIQELNNLYDLRAELAEIIAMRQALELAACPGAQALTGMPQPPGVRDKVGDLAIELADLSAKADWLRTEITRAEAPVEVYVAGIQDTCLQTVFRLRFIRAMTWREVAAILGQGYTEDGLRKAVNRHLGEIR